MPVTLPLDAKRRLVASIKRFFEEKLDDEIGDLKAELVFDYFLEEMAPSVYNQAVSDAQGYVQEKVQDIDGTCYEEEFAYWKPPRRDAT